MSVRLLSPILRGLVEENELSFRTLDDVDVKDKTVIVRVDLNSPLDPKTLKIIDDSRIRLHSGTINEIADKGGRVVVLAHQGRKGDEDFTDLSQHAEAMKKYMKHPLRFVKDVIGPEAVGAIRSLQGGRVLLLDNVRSLDEETKELSPQEHAKGKLVSTLSPLANLFVNDAFAAAHRSHASIVGFTVTLPSVVGRVMERELNALKRVYEEPEKPSVYVFGGAKPKETFVVIGHVLDKGIADRVLVGGMVSTVLAYVSGQDVGEKNVQEIKGKGFEKMFPTAKAIMEKYPDKIVIPVDVAIDVNGKRKEVKKEDFPPSSEIRDIGSETIRLFSEFAKDARSLVINGPLGLFEDEKFATGTVEFIRSLSKSKAYSVMGGGHSVAALEQYGIADCISYISTGGGAMISYLSGERLPGVEALKAAAK